MVTFYSYFKRLFFTYLPVHLPLLHLAVGFARMIDKSRNVSHPVAIDNCATVEIQTIVVTFLRVFLRHPSPEFLFTYNLPKVLGDQITC